MAVPMRSRKSISPCSLKRSKQQVNHGQKAEGGRIGKLGWLAVGHNMVGRKYSSTKSPFALLWFPAI